MTRLLTLIRRILRRPAAPEPPAPEPEPEPARTIPVHVGGKPYTLEIYE